MNRDELIQQLKADGWTFYRDNLRPLTDNFFKRFDTPTRCHCNDRPGMQVQIKVSAFSVEATVELNIRGQLPDDSWVDLTNYGFGEITSLEQITKTIPRLLAMWECANQPKP